MNGLLEIIARETQERGVISFARFMELALYCPVYGYYEKERDTVGRRGDFFTSVSVGSLFGELLAFQFTEWLDELRSLKCEVRIVEAGAHDGQLAKDVLLWLRGRRPGLYEELEYVIIEPSLRRQEWQKQLLREFENNICWVARPEELGEEEVCGVLFSNELLDAMPVHRWGWDAGKREWIEWGVAVQDGKLVWAKIENPEAGGRMSEGRSPKSEVRSPKSGSRIMHHASRITYPELPDALLEVLPDGFTTEICPAAVNWWREAARILGRGKLLTIDYGHTAEEFFAPERKEGTLRAYYRHHLSQDLLANPGEQDITAHVNFSAIQSAGEAAGLRTEQFITQTTFLTQITARVWKEQRDAGEWTRARTRQFQTLTHPDHLGQRFRVLVQSR